nr:hypothetical protein [Tanacetum cinerariifolium]
EDDKVKEYQNGMTHFHGVKGNNCQAILQGLEYPSDGVIDSPYRGVLDDQRTLDDPWFVLREKVKRGDETRKRNFY